MAAQTGWTMRSTLLTLAAVAVSLSVSLLIHRLFGDVGVSVALLMAPALLLTVSKVAPRSPGTP